MTKQDIINLLEQGILHAYDNDLAQYSSEYKEIVELCLAVGSHDEGELLDYFLQGGDPNPCADLGFSVLIYYLKHVESFDISNIRWRRLLNVGARFDIIWNGTTAIHMLAEGSVLSQERAREKLIILLYLYDFDVFSQLTRPKNGKTPRECVPNSLIERIPSFYSQQDYVDKQSFYRNIDITPINAYLNLPASDDANANASNSLLLLPAPILFLIVDCLNYIDFTAFTQVCRALHRILFSKIYFSNRNCNDNGPYVSFWNLHRLNAVLHDAPVPGTNIIRWNNGCVSQVVVKNILRLIYSRVHANFYKKRIEPLLQDKLTSYQEFSDELEQTYVTYFTRHSLLAPGFYARILIFAFLVFQAVFFGRSAYEQWKAELHEKNNIESYYQRRFFIEGCSTNGLFGRCNHECSELESAYFHHMTTDGEGSNWVGLLIFLAIVDVFLTFSGVCWPPYECIPRPISSKSETWQISVAHKQKLRQLQQGINRHSNKILRAKTLGETIANLRAVTIEDIIQSSDDEKELQAYNLHQQFANNPQTFFHSCLTSYPQVNGLTKPKRLAYDLRRSTTNHQ